MTTLTMHEGTTPDTPAVAPVKTNRHALIIALVVLIALYATATIAGGDGGGPTDGAFDEFYDWLVGLAKGTMGKILTILFLIFGIASGVARGTVAAAVPALGAAALLFFGPDIIDTIFSASLIVR